MCSRAKSIALVSAVKIDEPVWKKLEKHKFDNIQMQSTVEKLINSLTCQYPEAISSVEKIVHDRTC